MVREEHEKIVLQELHNLFEYRDGTLWWKPRPLESKSRNSKHAGRRAGTIDGKGYLIVNIKFGGVQRAYKAHRLIWAMCTGNWPVEDIDHINQNRLDNHIENLRDVNNTENSRNRQRPNNNTSGVVGVYWHKINKLWQASNKVNGKQTHLGYFSTVEEATIARRDAEKKYGFHANHGRPNNVR